MPARFRPPSTRLHQNVAATTLAATLALIPFGLVFPSGAEAASHLGASRSIFPAAVPEQKVTSDPRSVELGVRWRPSVTGWVTGVRYYAGSGSTSKKSGSLWTARGKRLAHVTFTPTAKTGWHKAKFAKPVRVTRGSIYVASYFANGGHYAGDAYGLSKRVKKGKLTALGSRYTYSSTSTFPTSSYRKTNYYVDVIFRAGQAKPGSAVASPPRSTAPRPAAPGPAPAPAGGGSIASGAIPSPGQVGFRGSSTSLVLADPSHVPAGMRYNSAGGYFELNGSAASRTWAGYRFTRPVKFSDSLPAGAGITLTFRDNVFDVPGNQYLGGLTYQGSAGTNRFVITDNTFRAASALAGNWGNGQIQMDAPATIARNDISGRADGIQQGSGNVLIEQNYIHHPGNWGTYPNNTHNDGMQFYGGPGIVLRHNRVDLGAFDGEHQNAALFFQGNFSAPQISHNYLRGGGFYLRLESGVSNAAVTSNTFAPIDPKAWGYVLAQGSIATWTGNVTTTGQTVGRP